MFGFRRHVTVDVKDFSVDVAEIRIKAFDKLLKTYTENYLNARKKRNTTEALVWLSKIKTATERLETLMDSRDNEN